MRRLLSIKSAGLFSLLLVPLIAYAASEFAYIKAGKLDVDNVRIDGNTISTLNANGDLTIDLNGTGSTIFTDLTATTVPYLDGSKKLTSSAVTPTELGYLSGVTSAIQTQLGTLTSSDALKAPIASPTFTGTITTPLTASRAVVTSGGSALAVATTTATEIGYVNGVTSAIQTQMDLKAPKASPVFTGTIGTPLTASRAIATDGSGNLSVSTTTATELGYVAGATSSLQTQINAISVSTTSPSKINNCALAVSDSADALTIALKDQAGSNPSVGSPCVIAFQNSSSSTASYTEVSVTAATSVVVSNGSTLGCTNSNQCRLFVYAINNAGTVVLGVGNGVYIDESETLLATTTAEGGAGAADSAGVIYTTAAQASKYARLIGRIRDIESTAGAWSSGPGPRSIQGQQITDIGPIYGSASIAATGSCSWTRISATFGIPGTTAACPAPASITQKGGPILSTTDTDLPEFTLLNLPAGSYWVCMSFMATGGSANSSYELTDTNSSTILAYAQSAANKNPITLCGPAVHTGYNATSTFNVQVASTSGTVTIDNSAGLGGFFFSYYRIGNFRP